MDDEAVIDCVRDLAARGLDHTHIADRMTRRGIKITRDRVAAVLERLRSPEAQMPPKRHDWTEQRSQFALDLWRAGATGSEVADALNKKFKTEFTRNAVIGRMNRLGAPPRSRPSLSLINARDGVSKPKDRKERQRAEKPRPAPAKPAAIPEPAKAPVFFKRVAVDHSVFDPRPGRSGGTAYGAVGAIAEVEGCRWPYGDPLSAEFHFCDQSRVCGSSYCQEHHAIAFTRRTGGVMPKDEHG